MSDTAKQSPLGVNVLSGLLQGKGFWINKTAAGYMGATTGVDNYTDGTITSNTKLTAAIRAGWVAYDAGNITSVTYNNLINMGSTTIPALGNTKPPSYTYTDPDLGPFWVDYYDNPTTTEGEVPSYGFIRLYALQAYNEFNYNNTLKLTNFYTDFVGSFSEAASFVDYSNQALMAMQNSFTFLDGTYSNMNDLITGDITGVSLSTRVFGQDLIALGKALNLSKIRTFGFPSNVLETLKTYNALTESVVLALLASGLTNAEVEQVCNNVNVTTTQQQKIYAAFTIISGVDLESILISLNCKTPGLTTLADLLDIRKLFPNSYLTLTVPIYNAEPGLPTNSKTYYPIFSVSGGVNSSILSPAVAAVVGAVIPPGAPVIDPPAYTEFGGTFDGGNTDNAGENASDNGDTGDAGDSGDSGDGGDGGDGGSGDGGGDGGGGDGGGGDGGGGGE